jgi:integrase
MTFYNRNDILYVSINGIRKSTKLKYSKENIKKFKSYYQDEEFYNKFNINKTIPTVLQFCNEVINEKEKDLKRNSFRSYLALYNSRIEPYFKNILVTEFKPIDVYNWFNTFQDSSTLNTCYSIVKSAFEKAIINGYITSSPFIIKRPKLKSKYQINPFTYDEAKQIINLAPANLKNLIAVCFYTGMRTGEVLGLKWEKVNFDNFTITIDNQITLGKEDTPKTLSSIRIIDMIPQCEIYLKEQFKITSKFEFVFLNSQNSFFTSSSVFQYSWKELLKKLNIEYRSIYQTRHTFASNMISNGENTLWVSQMLGHKTLNTTLLKYSKYIKITGDRKYTYLDG